MTCREAGPLGGTGRGFLSRRCGEKGYWQYGQRGRVQPQRRPRDRRLRRREAHPQVRRRARGPVLAVRPAKLDGSATGSRGCATSFAPRSARSGCLQRAGVSAASWELLLSRMREGRRPLRGARGAAQIRRLTYRAVLASEKAERTPADLSCPASMFPGGGYDDGNGKA